MQLKKLFFWGIVMCSFLSSGQDYFPTNGGVKSKNTNYTVFTNAIIHTTPTETIKKGTLVIREGKIVAVGKSVTIPSNATIVDLNGKHIYASFIDVYTNFGIKKPERKGGGGRSPQYDNTRDGYYWNDHIRPETEGAAAFKYDSKKASEFLKAGFGVLGSHQHDGIARGTGMLVALNPEGNKADRILDQRLTQHFSFDKSNTSNQSYPSSKMGATALLRQLHYDLDWYAKGNIKSKDLSLEALLENKSLPQIFEGDDLYDAMRIDKIGDQFDSDYIIVAGGDEYKRINEIKNLNRTFIVPLNFPDAYDVENPYQAAYVSLADMKHWNQAPTNPKLFEEKDIPFVLTTFRLKSPGAFKGNLMKAIHHGLSEEKALAALTTLPAQLLGKSNEIGSLKKGSWANFMITSDPVFDKKSTTYEHWVQGEKTVFKDMNVLNIDGGYDLNIDGTSYKLEIKGSTKKASAILKRGDEDIKSEMTYADGWINLTFASSENKFTRLIAQADGTTFIGKVVLPNGTETPLNVRRTGSEDGDNKKGKDKDNDETPEVLPLTYPNIAFGFKNQPTQQDILIQGATVWTNEVDGVLENTDVLIKDGKISQIGNNLSARGALVIDGTGKHLTAGIIDEHSHIGAFAINESGHNSTAEVRMSDVINPDDSDIYRNLAGGVTSIQLLHGSANPIGGQSAVMKLKWGASIDEMLLADKKFIKFALGENVKQSNWQSFSRFPQTRMGVEQVFVDYFQRAKEYETLKNSGQPYRFDEEMETVVDILNEERYISCHSYVQSEINMLMKVAERFNFRINTFTHILEGYKVADKMATHGVGGSTFSDWWAYKFEVNDAIPYNAAIMHKAGVVVAINSDDAEMSRRLNQEAAKIVKYGGVSEEDALKMVTLNPAKLLHMDDHTGSIKVGKDGDVVLWTDHPLSIKAKAEKTIIEGTIYFDLDRDLQLRSAVREEKSKLTAMMLSEKKKGLKTQAPRKKEKQRLHCDTNETIH